MSSFYDNNWYCSYGNGSSTGYYAVTAWAAGATIAVGALRRQLAAPSVGSERVFVAIVAGTTGGSEPSWTTTRGAKTTDNTVTWQECTGICSVNGDVTNTPNWTTVKSAALPLGQIIKNVAATYYFILSTAGTAGSGSEPSWTLTAGVTTADNTCTWTCLGAVGGFSAWGAPHARTKNACATNWAGGSIQNSVTQTIFLADNSAETMSTRTTIDAASQVGLFSFLSVDHTASVPPTGVLAGAAIKNTNGSGGSNITIGGNGTALHYWYGVTFEYSGASTNAQLVFGGGGNTYIVLDGCTLKLSGSTNTQITFGSSGGNNDLYELNNTTCYFTAVGQIIVPMGCRFNWRNTASAIGGTSVPTNVIDSLFTQYLILDIEGVDFSAAGSGKTILLVPSSGAGYARFKDCKFGSGAALDNTINNATYFYVDYVRCDSAGTNYKDQRSSNEGTTTTETVVVRTNGASNGTTQLTHKYVTGTGPLWVKPHKGFPIAVWNTVLSTNRTVKLYGVVNGASVPNNDEFWFDVEYLGASSSPMGSLASGTKANALTANAALTADTSAWDTLVTARANSHANVVGDVIKVASNTGRIFFCTTGGTTAGSEPGGYASAVDGGSVTDGSAVFRAGCRFSQTLTLSSPQPAQVGYIYSYPKAAKASTTYYLDPLPTLG